VTDDRIWAIYHDKIYDLSDYLYTVQFYSSSSGTDLPNYTFLNEDITDLVKNRPGQDLTKDIDKVLAGLSADDAKLQTQCLDNAFLVGKTDFRKTARCTTQNYLLLAFSVLLMSTIAMKCKKLHRVMLITSRGSPAA
jgi:chitin synthase